MDDGSYLISGTLTLLGTEEITEHGSGEFIGMGTTARYWTATKNGYSYGWYRQLDNDNSATGRDFQGVCRGHSVRCMKDD